MKLKKAISTLYFSREPRALRFQFALLSFDIVTIVFFIVSSLMEPSKTIFIIDYFLAFVLTGDFLARMYVSPKPLKFAREFSSITDLIVIFSLVSSALIENLGFLRVVRMLRLIRSYHMARELRNSFTFFKQNEEIIHSTINLSVFIFIITAIIYVLEVDKNDSINNYLDALYFTVATLTTTGFGDITLSDTLGRLIAVIIMVFGVGLFLRLVQTIFRPNKVSYRCTTCGLTRHEGDAVHCKHCGNQLNIPTEGDWS
ncbi:MAG: voltage-gated potassium channel [Oceanicoccus sp.]|jgi:voltage-gated potassium channel